MKFGWLIVALLVAVFLAVSFGGAPIPLTAVVHGLIDPPSRDGLIMWRIRIPRVILGFLVGGALGLSGTALQSLVRNPLAEPYLLGISGGAGLGAVAAIAIGVGAPILLPLCAFVGALAASYLVYRIAVLPGRRLDPKVLVLAGVVVAALCSAITSALLSVSDAAQLRNAFLWLLGGLSAASWTLITAFVAYATLPIAALFYSSRRLDLLALGDETAHGLGLEAIYFKRFVFLVTTLLTAACVAATGMIGFVGLVAPHAMRGWVGPLHRRLLPATFLASGALLVVADTVARTVLRPVELPVGAVTALIGVPLLGILLRRSLA